MSGPVWMSKTMFSQKLGTLLNQTVVSSLWCLCWLHHDSVQVQLCAICACAIQSYVTLSTVNGANFSMAIWVGMSRSILTLCVYGYLCSKCYFSRLKLPAIFIWHIALSHLRSACSVGYGPPWRTKQTSHKPTVHEEKPYHNDVRHCAAHNSQRGAICNHNNIMATSGAIYFSGKFRFRIWITG